MRNTKENETNGKEMMEYFEWHRDGSSEAHRCTRSTAEKMMELDRGIVFACYLGLIDGVPSVIETIKGDERHHEAIRAAVEYAQYLFETEEI